MKNGFFLPFLCAIKICAFNGLARKVRNMVQQRPRIRIAAGSSMFYLPLYVARDEGFFDEAGLDVAFAEGDGNTAPSPEDVFQRLKENQYDECQADTYNICEWAGVDRTERGSRPSRVVGLRAAVAAQAIISFDARIQEPRDLAGVPIGVNNRAGSHYATAQLLEGAIAPEHARIEHAGAPQERYAALKDGRYRAATLMEPFISLALKEGAHIVNLTFYRGVEVVSTALAAWELKAYFSAVDRAVDLINQDFGKYKHVITRRVGDALAPHELSSQYVRYVHTTPFTEDRFQDTYDSMQRWKLTDGQSHYASVAATI